MITHVAIVFEGRTYSLPKPYRHHDVIRQIYEVTGKGMYGPDIQGFLDHNGTFLNRKQALEVAISCEQLIDENIISGRLYSENLW